MRIGQKSAGTQVATAVAVLLVASEARAASADAYYERSFVVAAHARCDLFEPKIEAALSAAAAQARGAALRGGATVADLAVVAARARGRAAAVSCRDPELATVRSRVDHAFSGWARTPRMTFPGARLDWVVNRYSWDRAVWRLKQAAAVGASPIAFGYAGLGDAPRLEAVISWHGRPRPYAARVVMRDPAKMAQPWLSGDGLAPPPARASYWASGVEAADPALLASGQASGDAWRFPAGVASGLARLDPRESFSMEFHFRDGSIATARFEAGDFSAGRAFLAMGQP